MYMFSCELNVCFLISTATASYRLLPEITIIKPCEDELADKLVKCFSDGVIKVEHKDGTIKHNNFITPRDQVFRDQRTIEVQPS